MSSSAAQPRRDGITDISPVIVSDPGNYQNTHAHVYNEVRQQLLRNIYYLTNGIPFQKSDLAESEAQCHPHICIDIHG